METPSSNLQIARFQIISFLKWLLFACVVGVVVGIVGVAFHFGIGVALDLRRDHPWLLYLLPVAGLFIVWLYQVTDMSQDKGTNFILIAVRSNWRLRLRTAPLIFVCTILTHLCGGSAGREGAALQLGGSISAALGRAVHLDEQDSHIITMCGMAAGFAALFGTPIAAAVFAMEVVSVGVMYYAAAVPCILAALIAAQLSPLLGLPATSYLLSGVPAVSFPVLAQMIGLGISFALLSMVFCKTMHVAPALYCNYLPNPYLRVVVGGVLIILLTLAVQTTDYNGVGSQVIARAISGSAVPYAFVLKLLFTALTLGCGFKGGEIVPAFFVGATFGCVVAPLLGVSANFGAALGLVAVFCGVTNCPMTSILLSYELFGGKGLPLFALCCAVSYMLSGYSGLYHAQKITYSKFKAKYLDWNAK